MREAASQSKRKEWGRVWFVFLILQSEIKKTNYTCPQKSFFWAAKPPTAQLDLGSKKNIILGLVLGSKGINTVECSDF